MSFISNKPGYAYAPGYFVASQNGLVKKTYMIEPETTGDDYVPAGTIYPANDSTAIGVVYEDVDTSDGNAPGSLIKAGVIYFDQLPEEPTAAAKEALPGITFVSSPANTER